jgi:hypothetical protein
LMRVPLNGFSTVLTCVPRLHVYNARVNTVGLVFQRTNTSKLRKGRKPRRFFHIERSTRSAEAAERGRLI